MLSFDACQRLILSSPTFNLPSCCATNPVSCHFLRSSDCSLKAPSPPDKEEGNRHCLATDTPTLAPLFLQLQIKGPSCPHAPLIIGLVSLREWTPGLLHFHLQIGFQWEPPRAGLLAGDPRTLLCSAFPAGVTLAASYTWSTSA